MAQSYENLNIWKESILLVEEVYRLTRKFPKDEVFGITSQIRRAIVSVSSNIAEGSSRSSKKDYSRFIDIAIGSIKEVENLIHISARLGYIQKIDSGKLLTRLDILGRSLGAFRKYLNS